MAKTMWKNNKNNILIGLRKWLDPQSKIFNQEIQIPLSSVLGKLCTENNHISSKKNSSLIILPCIYFKVLAFQPLICDLDSFLKYCP